MHKRIFSGIQPTNSLHLGNYLGALRHWVTLQEDFESFFCVVDLHALTVAQDPQALRQHSLSTAAAYMAAGINPEKSVIFIQSMVPVHTEVMWILACHTPLGWLNRMTQFKDKVGKNSDKEKAGLYAYPILMAADILSYQATHVPVGEDQKQHLEFTRDLAQLLNRTYEVSLFTVPEVQTLGVATRVMSLRDGEQKMSKSDPADASRINLLDSPESIQTKIRKAKTDAFPFPNSSEALQGRPEVRNLFRIYQELSGLTAQAIFEDFGSKNLSVFKNALSDLIIEALGPFQKSYRTFMEDKGALERYLEKSAEKAHLASAPTLRALKKAVGLPV